MSDRTTPAESADRLRRFARMIKLPPGDNLLEDAARIIDRLSSPSTAPAVGGAPETGWLAEHGRRGEGNVLVAQAKPEWWAVLDGEGGFVEDSLRALRFARREDAEAFIADAGWTEVFASEHMWSDPSQRYADRRAALVPLNTSEKRVSREKVIEEIAAERERQKTVEGRTDEHDDKHAHGELAYIAASYALEGWDSDRSHKDKRRSLVKAGARIVAEIERIDRALNPEHAKEQEVSDG